MKQINMEDFEWLTKLEPDSATKNYYAMYFLDTHAAFEEGWETGFKQGFDAGFDQAVNTLHSDKDIQCVDCGSNNTIAYLTVHSN